MAVDPHKPFKDGRLFDDTFGMHDSVKRELCYQGLLYATSFSDGNQKYGGLIIARSEEHACERASERGFGERIDGRLEAYGSYDDLPPPQEPSP